MKVPRPNSSNRNTQCLVASLCCLHTPHATTTSTISQPSSRSCSEHSRQNSKVDLSSLHDAGHRSGPFCLYNINPLQIHNSPMWSDGLTPQATSNRPYLSSILYFRPLFLVSVIRLGRLYWAKFAIGETLWVDWRG